MPQSLCGLAERRPTSEDQERTDVSNEAAREVHAKPSARLWSHRLTDSWQTSRKRRFVWQYHTFLMKWERTVFKGQLTRILTYSQYVLKCYI